MTDTKGAGVELPVQQPLTLVMPVRVEALDQLRATVQALAAAGLERALNKIGTVHATRFVVVADDADEPKWARLMVIATFDGAFEPYLRAFAVELNDPFNILFGFISDRPNLPVIDNQDEFIAYVSAHLADNGRTYSAYPGLTALDIWEATRPMDDGAPVLR
jgi:hypothetical protein